MILKNYKALKCAINKKSQWQYYSCVGVVATDGTAIITIYQSYSSTQGIDGYNYGSLCLNRDITALIGTGTTEPTINDYQLENDISSSFSNLAISSNVSNNVGETYAYERIITITGLNNTSDDITISEIGLQKNMQYANSTNATNKKVLLVRHLLDTPITVAPNETFSITLIWRED